MEFDAQSFLRDMRQENVTSLAGISGKVDQVDGKVDQVLVKVNDHETRIVVVEGTRRTLLWLAGAVVIAVLPVVFDLVVNHWR